MVRSDFPGGPQAGRMYSSDAVNMTLTALKGKHSLDEQAAGVPDGLRHADVEIVVPVYNEEKTLVASLQRLHRYLIEHFPLTWAITVADNASTDGTWGLACRLSQELDGVRAVHINQKGRGRALKAVWAASEASVVAYMDVDLSTDLDALLPLVAPLFTGHSDVAIGSRLAPGARVVRGPKREIISRAYNFMLRVTLHNSFTDAQCGFKAVRADVARQLVPLIKDDGWFFDTELLVLAERNGFRVHEVAVDWVDDPDSRVDIPRTARDDIKGIVRLLRDRPTAGPPTAARSALPGPTGQVVHFAAVGTLSTAAFALLFALLYRPIGPMGADVVALVLCAFGNLAANRRYTFTATGPGGRRDYYRRGLALALLPLAATLAALELIGAVGWDGLPVDLVALTAVNLCSTVARFGYLCRAATSLS